MGYSIKIWEINYPVILSFLHQKDFSLQIHVLFTKFVMVISIFVRNMNLATILIDNVNKSVVSRKNKCQM